MENKYTQVDIMHRLHTRLEHSCANVHQPIRDHDVDLMHVIEEVDELMDNIEDIKADLCHLTMTDTDTWTELNALLGHILKHLDDVHFMLRSKVDIESHNKNMYEMRIAIANLIARHINKHAIYNGYDFRLGK